jgi:hypothetical protein
MYRVSYGISRQDNDVPKDADIRDLRRALASALRLSQQDNVGWIDITNNGSDSNWHHADVPDSNFKWRNGQKFAYEELPEWMRVEKYK